MKSMGFYADRNRSGNLLHIETDGCIVNIHVGLHDNAGRQVTSVRINPDNRAEPGGKWVLDGSRVIQLLPGENELPVELPEATSAHGWSRDDLLTLIVTAGEIAATYGTGTDGLDRDDVLSTRQRSVLRQAAQFYTRYIGEDEEGGN